MKIIGASIYLVFVQNSTETMQTFYQSVNTKMSKALQFKGDQVTFR